MKGGISRYRGKEFFLLLIVVVGTSFLIWGWDRTPFPTPEDQLQFSREISLDAEKVSQKDELEVGKHGSTESEVSGDSNVEETSPKETTTTDINENQDVDAENFGNVESSDAAEQKDKQKIGEKDLTRDEEPVDVKLPANPATKNSSHVPPRHKKNHTVLASSQTCNYAKGKWVVDNRGPLYSGFECKQWLAQMWACRLMQRTDFSYENLRWQPIGCQMEPFEGHKFLERMRDKTLAFVGDSLGRQQFQSMMCMVTGGKESPDVVDVGSEYGLVIPEGGSRPNGWAYRFPTTNTTILYYWSSCLCDLDPINATNPATEYAMHLDRPPAFLTQYLHKINVLVLNTGHHWNRGKIQGNRWVMYVGGKPNINKNLAKIGDAKNFTIHSIVSWVNKQLPKHPQLKAFYRSISPRHFVNGDWNTGGSCNNTTPMSVGKEIRGDESSDYSAWRAVRGTGVKLLDVTALSQLRDEGHISRYSITASPRVQDCLHWCLPGVPDTWNEILFAQISDMSRGKMNE